MATDALICWSTKENGEKRSSKRRLEREQTRVHAQEKDRLACIKITLLWMEVRRGVGSSEWRQRRGKFMGVTHSKPLSLFLDQLFRNVGPPYTHTRTPSCFCYFRSSCIALHFLNAYSAFIQFKFSLNWKSSWT